MCICYSLAKNESWAAISGEREYDVVVFYNTESDMNTDQYPVEFIEYGDNDHLLLDDMTHKWWNIGRIWDEYETILVLDNDTKLLKDPTQLLEEFNKSSYGVGGCVVENLETSIMYEYARRENQKTHLQGSQMIFNTRYWPNLFDFAEEYMKVLIGLKKYKKRIETKTDSNPDAESAINILIMQHMNDAIEINEIWNSITR